MILDSSKFPVFSMIGQFWMETSSQRTEPSPTRLFLPEIYEQLCEDVR